MKIEKVNSWIFVFGIMTILFAACQQQTPIVFSPGEIWPDNNGVHINAHGGGILYFNNVYYWYGEHKVSGPIGNTAQVGVHVYSSTNLYDWVDLGIALKVDDDEQSDIAKGCILERPKVIYNEKTGKFVMWFHLELKDQGYDAALSGVAVSDNPEGPFQYIRSFRPNAGYWPVNVQDYHKNRYTTALNQLTVVERVVCLLTPTP